MAFTKASILLLAQRLEDRPELKLGVGGSCMSQETLLCSVIGVIGQMGRLLRMEMSNESG